MGVARAFEVVDAPPPIIWDCLSNVTVWDLPKTGLQTGHQQTSEIVCALTDLL